MTTPQQVKQGLKFLLSLTSDLEGVTITPNDRNELIELVGQLQSIIKSTKVPIPVEETTVKKVLKHPVDALLKKRKVKLSENRYQQLTFIYDEMTTALGVKFLEAKQSQDAVWFPLDFKGDKTGALFFHGSTWSVASTSKTGSKGEWEDFDLIDLLYSNNPDMDFSEY